MCAFVNAEERTIRNQRSEAVLWCHERHHFRWSNKIQTDCQGRSLQLPTQTQEVTGQKRSSIQSIELSGS